jgi:hypothetical protein
MVSIAERQRMGGAQEPPLRWRQPSRDGKRLAIATIILVLGLIGGGIGLWDRRGPHAATEIFDGIVYGSVKLDETPEGPIDLTAPGIELYVTPLDPSAIVRGWSADLANSVETVVADHVVSHTMGAQLPTFIRRAVDPLPVAI